MFNPKKIIISTLLIISLALSAQSSKQKPNVIILLADDIGYGDLDWIKDVPTINTPNVQRLANEGISFANAHCTSATCTPSRYGLLTGTYPWRKKDTGVASGDAAMIIKPNQVTIADMFKSQGYVTGAFGKWHLGLGNKKGEQDWNGEISPSLKDIGFDSSFIMSATGDRVPCVYIENGRVVNLDPNDPIEVSYSKNFEGEPTGKNNPEMLRLHPSYGHDMTIVDGISRIGFMKGGHSARWHDEDIADNIIDKAVKFIENNKNQPFFMYLCTNDIHVPRMPNDKFKGKSGMGLRGDAILEFDYTVGKIMQLIDNLNIGDNTIFILTSDNGPVIDDGYKDEAAEKLGNHKPSDIYRGGKYSIFEAGTRVPFIVRWKDGIKKTSISNALFSQIDLFASLADIINAKIPYDAAPDSKNYSNTLLGKNKKGREYLIQEGMNNVLAIQDRKGWKFIEPNNYKPKSNSELGNSKQDQLYNLNEDVNEQNNLGDKNSKILNKLKKQLEKEKELGFLN